MRTKETAKSLYLKEVFSKEDDILRSIREYSEKKNVEYMQISAYEGGILQFLCQTLLVKKAVEIGTLYGYSSLMIARTLPEDGQLFTLDIDKDRTRKSQSFDARRSFCHKDSFPSWPALESLKKLKNKAPFDMVFVDADKSAYLDYLHWSNKYLKPGGLLIADNTFLFGAVYGEPEGKTIEKGFECDETI